MQRLRKQQGVMVATAIGLVLLGGISYAARGGRTEEAG